MEKKYFIVSSENTLEYDFSTNETLQYSIEQEIFSETPSVAYVDEQYSASLNIPAAIFQKGLTPFQAIVKYLREEAKITNKEISGLLKRDLRTIWATYRSVESKKIDISDKKDGISIPISIFHDDRLSIFEALVFYLRSLEKRYSEIAMILNKDQRTIWTVYSRAKGKLEEKDES